MTRVVVGREARTSEGFRIDGKAFHHAVRVLRVRNGDLLRIVDGSGIEYECTAERMSAREFVARIVRQRPLAAPARVSIRLYCGLLKGDKLDLVLQKTTELGVDVIGIFRSERTTVRVAREDEGARRDRWTRIVEGAVAQCGRSTVPSVVGPLEFLSMVQAAASADLSLLTWEGDGVESLPRLSSVVDDHPDVKSISVIIGTEGGFSRRESEAARAEGLIAVSLGPRILRAETAAIIVPALLASWTGDLG